VCCSVCCGGLQWVCDRATVFAPRICQLYLFGSCCSVLQRVAACCSGCCSGCCSVLECVLQRVCKSSDSAFASHLPSLPFLFLLQRVAACCSMLQRVAACCSMFKCVVVCVEACCSVLQCVLQCVLQWVCDSSDSVFVSHLPTLPLWFVLQRVAACCSVLQCVLQWVCDSNDSVFASHVLSIPFRYSCVRENACVYICAT